MEKKAFLSLKTILFKKYLILSKIDEGSFGSIYLSKNIITNEKVAVKIESRKIESPLLEREAYILFYLRGPGLPQVKTFGRTKDFLILIQTLLGPSLATLLDKYSIIFTMKDICMLSIQMIERLEYIHSKNFIHRDIKPQNFLMGISEPDKVYLIDFGLAKKFRSKKGKHIKFSLNNNITGTPRYCSINGLRGAEQSRRDDLESLFYVIMYFFRGNLPWQNLKIKSRSQRFNRINQLKKNVNYKSLCENLPNELFNFGIYIKHLKFEDEPDYNYLKNCFNSILRKINAKYDNKFSWINIFNSYSNIKRLTYSHENNFRKKNSSHKRLFEKISSSLEKKMMQKSEEKNLSKEQIHSNNITKDNITLKSLNIENNNRDIKKSNSYVANSIKNKVTLKKKISPLINVNILKNKSNNLKFINRNIYNNNIKKNKTQFYCINFNKKLLHGEERNNFSDIVNFKSNSNESLQNIFAKYNKIKYTSPNFVLNLKKKENSVKNIKITFFSKENYAKIFERNKKLKNNYQHNYVTVIDNSFQKNKKLNLPNNSNYSNNMKIINFNKDLNNKQSIKSVKNSIDKTNLRINYNNYKNINKNNMKFYSNINTEMNEISNNKVKRTNTDFSLSPGNNNIYKKLNIKYNPLTLRNIDDLKRNKINNQNINLNIKLINNNNYNNFPLKNSKNKLKVNKLRNLNLKLSNDINYNNIIKKQNSINKVRVNNYKANRQIFNNFTARENNLKYINPRIYRSPKNKVGISSIPFDKNHLKDQHFFNNSYIIKK